MNMRVAQAELREPPKVRPYGLALEAVAFVAVSYFLVGFII
jgi:hypothetical protein